MGRSNDEARISGASSFLISTLWLLACGHEETAEPAPFACPAPSRAVGDACVEPGVQDSGCPAGTTSLADGGCRPAGIMEGECGDGFTHDGDVGCTPILPLEACPSGLMAVPGDSACRPIMDCGSGTWGDIPVDAETEYVDQTFVGVSDGTAAAPWTTIGDGVAAAGPGGLVAVAAGTYVENVGIVGKRIRLHGVCPEQVSLVGSAGAISALDMRGGTSGSEVRGLSIRGDTVGIAMSGSEQILFEQLHVHDTASAGIVVQDNLGPTSCAVRSSLLERNTAMAMFVGGSEASVEGSVLRDAVPDASDKGGRGAGAEANPNTGAPAALSMHGSVVERHRGVGVLVAGSLLTVESTVVRNGIDGASGIDVIPYPTTLAPSELQVRGSMFDRNGTHALLISGCKATIESTVVRDTQLDQEGTFGWGFAIQWDPDSLVPSTTTIHGSLIERNHMVGVFVSRSDAIITATVVRDTVPDGFGIGGRGANIQSNTEPRARADLQGMVFDRNTDLGIYVLDAEVAITGSLVRATAEGALGDFGDGVNVQSARDPAEVFLTSSVIEQSARAGLSNFGSLAAMATTAITCAAFELDGEVFVERDFEFQDLGGNGCGCPLPANPCKAFSSNLSPPPAIAE
jgi:hypothetical protein